MFSFIIFDLDGVVADTHEIHKRAWKQLLFELGHEVSEHDLHFVVEGHKRDEILRHFLASPSTEEILQFGERKAELFYQFVAELQTIAGVREFLDDLQSAGIHKALVTSASRSRTDYVLERLGLTRVFAAVVTGDDVEKGKPDPSAFQLAATLLQAGPEQSLVIEDSCAGVRAAKAAGMTCVGIASAERAARLKSEGADYVLPNFCGVSAAVLQAVF